MIIGMNHITLAVRDVQRSFVFYRDVIGLKPLCKWHKGAYFLVGNFWFCLNADLKRRPSPCYTHYAFSVDKDHFISVKLHLLDSGVRVFKDNTSSGESFYFLDPDDHKLEIHTEDWKARLLAKKKDKGTWKELEWFI